MAYSPASLGGFGDAPSPLGNLDVSPRSQASHRNDPRSPGSVNDVNDDTLSISSSSHGSGAVHGKSGDAASSQRPQHGEVRQEEKLVEYVCGECRKSMSYKVGVGQMLRCKSCGYRIFFKQRGTTTAVYDCR